MSEKTSNHTRLKLHSHKCQFLSLFPLLLLALALPFLQQNAFAEESLLGKYKPNVTGETLVKVGLDKVDRNNSSEGFQVGKGYDSTARIENFTRFNFTKNVSLNSLISYNRLPESAGSFYQSKPNGLLHYNKNHSLLVRELYMRFYTTDEDTTLTVGKIQPQFGVAWDKGYGIWGRLPLIEYSLQEKLGATIQTTVTTASRSYHTISASAFRSDNTQLSTANTFYQRSRNSTSAGGAGNTGNLGSYTIGVDGAIKDPIKSNFQNILNYHVSTRSLAKGKDGNKDERGYASSLEYAHLFSRSFNVRLLAEYVQLKNYNGFSGQRKGYLTSGIRAQHSRFIVAYSQSKISYNLLTTNARYRDSQYSLGYMFPNGVVLNVGRRFASSSLGAKKGSYGALVTYIISY